MISFVEQRLINEALRENQFAPNKDLVYYNGSDDPTGTALSYLIQAETGGKEKWSLSGYVDTHKL